MIYPLVTVIIPTYSRTSYLKLTLDSIMQQTFQDFEIIVVDDGTPNDDNFILCQQYSKLRYIKIENSGGPARPRNVGIKESRSKYIAFTDDDDLWVENKLEKQVAILETHPNFGLVHSYCDVIDEQTILQNTVVGRPGSPEVKHGNVSMKMMGNWTIMMPTTFVRKKIIDEVGFFNEKMPSAIEDCEYWIRTSFFTNFYYIDEPLAKYRIHSNNISTNSKAYEDLSTYLKTVLLEFKTVKRINDKQYNLLINSLCSLQIKGLKKHTYKAISNLFMLNPFWTFRWKNLKLMMFIILKR